MPTFNPAEYDGMSLPALAAEMDRVDKLVEAADEALKDLKARLEHLKIRRIPAALEEAGLKNIKLASGRGITVQDQWHVSSNKGNQPELFNWLRAEGAASLIQETVNASSLKAYIKDRVAHMLEYPSDIVKVTVIPTARFF